MKAIPLENKEQLDLIADTKGHTIIFKHNTSCPISKMAKSNFETEAANLPQDTPVFVLDLLSYREISNEIAERFKVKHESPQLLVIKDGECAFHQALYEISAEDAAKAIQSS